MFERRRKTTKLIHEGKYAAEVVIELHYTDESWSPTMSLDDARKLEAVQLAPDCFVAPLLAMMVFSTPVWVPASARTSGRGNLAHRLYINGR